MSDLKRTIKIKEGEHYVLHYRGISNSHTKTIIVEKKVKVSRPSWFGEEDGIIYRFPMDEVHTFVMTEKEFYQKVLY